MTTDTTIENAARHQQPRRIGLRERNKLDKLRRIKEAASELFTRQGYDETTTREIAGRADVGLGTLFSYAQDKRDLLYLIFNDDVEQTVTEAIAKIEESGDLGGNLITIFRDLYVFFSRTPKLSRFMLRELTYYDTSPQDARYQRIREQLLGVIVALVRRAQSQGRVTSEEDAEAAARGLFYIYQAEVRRWIGNDDVDVERGIEELKRLLGPLLRGLESD